MGRYAVFRAAVIRRGKKFLGYEEEHYPDENLISAAPNIGHDTDSFSSDWALLVDLWSRALSVALGGRLMREDINVTGGHKHDDFRTSIHWREIVRFRPLGDNQGTSGPPESKGLLYVTSTTPKDCLNGFVHIDDHISEVDLFVRVAQPAPAAPGTPDGVLDVVADLYDLNDSVTAVVSTTAKMHVESKLGGLQHPNRWLGPVRVPISSFVVIRGQRFLQVKLRASVRSAGTIGGIYEASIRRQRR